MSESYEEKMTRLRERAKKEARPKVRKLPSHVAIARYWTRDEEEKTFPKVWWSMPGCFACGFEPVDFAEDVSLEIRWKMMRLDRAHLVPHASGGSCDLDNVVLLCRRCHREAPMIGCSPRFMIDWINRRENWVIYSWRRILEECGAIDPHLLEKVLGSAWGPAGETPKDRRIDFESKMEMMARFLKVDVHPGGDPIPSTVAVLIAMSELALPKTERLCES